MWPDFVHQMLEAFPATSALCDSADSSPIEDIGLLGHRPSRNTVENHIK